MVDMVDISSSSLPNLLSSSLTEKPAPSANIGKSGLRENNEATSIGGNDFNKNEFLKQVADKFGEDVARQILNEDGSINFKKLAEIISAKKLSEVDEKEGEEDGSSLTLQEKAKVEELEKEQASLLKAMQLLYMDTDKRKNESENLLSFLA
jgi:hypothetical protein